MPDETSPPALTHLDVNGDARMVDVSDKPSTRRSATARSLVRAHPDTIALLCAGGAPKGDALAVARIAAIQAAKRTDTLIPLCHSLGLDHVDVRFEPQGDHIAITATATNTGRTGVEMEAMVAASIAGLTLYDMAKAVDRAMSVGPVELVEKRGGKSGHWRREP